MECKFEIAARTLCCKIDLITPHAQHEQGKVVSVVVHIQVYIYMFVDQKKFESYFSDRLTFSNIRSRTSRRI